MTGSMAYLGTLALAALTAGGVMVAQTGFDGDGSFDAGSRAGVGTDATAGVSAGAHVSLEADATAESSNECFVNCLAPCATRCAPHWVTVEGAAQLRSGFSAEVAPEHSCICSDNGTTLETDGDAEAGSETEASSEDGGASVDVDGSLTAALTSTTSGTATFDVD